MNLYWFEHWQSGRMTIETCPAHSVQEAVSLLSDLHPKGVFRLKDKQTQVERVKENWLEFERVLGD